VEPATRPPEKEPAPPEETLNWKCSRCGGINLARRTICVTCSERKGAPVSKPKFEVHKAQPKGAGFLSQTQSSTGERPRAGGFLSQNGRSTSENVGEGGFLGQQDRSIGKRPRFGSVMSHNDRSTGERVIGAGFSSPNNRSTGETLREEGQRQLPFDFGRSTSEADPERPVWRHRGYNPDDGRGRSLPSQNRDQTDRFSLLRGEQKREVPIRYQEQADQRPVRRLDQERSFPDQERTDRLPVRTIRNQQISFQGPFRGNQREELAERGPAVSVGATLNPAEQLFQSRANGVNRGGVVDTGDRSGMDALLQHTVDEKKTKSLPARPIEADIRSPRLRTRNAALAKNTNTDEATNTLQASEGSNSLDNILPDLLTNAEPFLYRGDEDILSIRKLRHKSRFQDKHEEFAEEESRRIRGRFQAELEEPQVAETRVEPRLERKSERRASSRRSDYGLNDPDEELLSGGRGRKKKQSNEKNRDLTTSRTPIQLPEFISVENLATAVRVKTEDFINRMEEMGFERPRRDHILDAETSGLIAGEFNFEPTYIQESHVQDLVARPFLEDVSSLPSRPPIVTIMGHVDHGKTTILDWLRKSSVAESEHGGITQHIGAFSVTMPGGKQITFLDTPGHAAFLDMRRRGANVTDIVILVVAADDSVKPQTIEAIKHATDAKVPIIVAINKVDKEDANLDRVKQDLARHGITVEDYGGEVQAIPVSGKFGKGMEELEEATVTLSELLDHRAEVDGPVEGWIIESKVTMAGRVATVLVRRGTLRAGSIIVAGRTWARIRTLRNDAGVIVDEASPGTPVQIDGWRGDDPVAGWQVLQAEDEDHAKDVVELRKEREEYTKLAGDTAAINALRAEEAEARAKVLAWEADQQWASKRPNRRPKDNAGWVEGKASGGPKQVHFVVKADVSGSVEAVVNSVSAIGNNEIAANVIRSGVGVINESDVQHLASSGEVGYLISFNQPVDAGVSRLAEAAGLSILDHNIIYKLTDVVREKLTAELPPTITQRVVGEAEVEKIFEISVKKGKTKIAGCKINNGIITRDRKIRVLRGAVVIYNGKHSETNWCSCRG